jgi:hypothetical protein
VIPKTCNACGTVGAVKLASCYWAWMRADRSRVAWLQRLCFGCAVTRVVPLVAAAMEPLLACPACGVATVDDHDDVFLTFCPPGQASVKSEMPLCGPCAVEVRNFAQTGAVRLGDRLLQGSGAESSPRTLSGAEVWASLGLRPVGS